jgi:hypothetical protein
LVRVAGIVLCLAAVARADDFQGATHLMPFDEDTLQYSKSEATGPVARLQQRIDRGEVKLRHDARHGYLPALLESLGVPASSQMLVFSKTSFQRERISPSTPRALFFSDDVYVGYVAGSPLLEISMQDPKLGGVFYTLEQEQSQRPKLVRTDQCLECHASAKSLGVPGHLVRSFATDEQGAVDLASGTSLVTHRTPIADRWGGWYVTGEHGGQVHRGNLFGKAAFEKQARSPNHLGNLADLSRFFDTNQTPAAGSDIVALMVLEHQVHMHNFITRLHYESSLALAAYGHLRYLKNQIDAFLRYLLFVEEAPLTAPIRGRSGFQEHFESLAPKDPQGRSLRQFDLRTRLFRHPCSYLIYSEAFDALPAALKEQIYQRLHAILIGADTGPGFEKLSAQSRKDILDILRATKRGLPDNWKRPSAANAPASTEPAK